MNTVEKIKALIDRGDDFYDVARKIIDIEISKYAPVELDDLPDTATVASEVEAIVECLEQKDYSDAINLAQEAACIILEDEGFNLEQ